MSAASDYRCACGAPVRIPGVPCEVCRQTEWRERDRLDRICRFVNSLPEYYRANDFDGPDLAARVKDPTGIARGLAACGAQTSCVTVTGFAGVGKSSLAVAIARRHVHSFRGRGEYVGASDLAHARSRSRLGEEPEVVRAALEAGVLILDDLDLAPEVHGSAVVDVIHRRHRDGLLTIATTSLSPEETAARFGDGTSRRLFEKGIASVIALRAPKGAR
jgi:hypothetical protein